MNLHPAAATDERGAGLRILIWKSDEPDSSFPDCGDGLFRGANQQRRPHLLGGTRCRRHVSITVEAILGGVFAARDFEQSHIELRVSVGHECQCAGNMDESERRTGRQVKGDSVAGADLYPRPAMGTAPLSQVEGADQGPVRLDRTILVGSEALAVDAKEITTRIKTAMFGFIDENSLRCGRIGSVHGYPAPEKGA